MIGIKYKDVARVLKRNGFIPCKMGNTSHAKWEKDGKHLSVSTTGVNEMIWRRLCKEFSIDTDK